MKLFIVGFVVWAVCSFIGLRQEFAKRARERVPDRKASSWFRPNPGFSVDDIHVTGVQGKTSCWVTITGPDGRVIEKEVCAVMDKDPTP